MAKFALLMLCMSPVIVVGMMSEGCCRDVEDPMAFMLICAPQLGLQRHMDGQQGEGNDATVLGRS
jgi:hypothetical protein